MKITALALGLLLAASPAFATDIDGTWSGAIDTPNGPIPVSYSFKVAGEVLTGATVAPDGSSLPIANGKIKGNTLSFTLTLDFGGGATTFNYTGVVSGSELKLHTAFMDMPMDFLLKKT